MMQFITVEAQQAKFSQYPVYQGSDLGLTYSPSVAVFRVWAPAAEEVQLLLYTAGEGGEPIRTTAMHPDKSGCWLASLGGDWQYKFYTYRARMGDKWTHEVPDPYAKAVGVNGRRAMIIDLRTTDPPGWEKDKSPLLIAKNDAIIYELHIRDASIAAGSGITHKGKYIGLTEKGTTSQEGLSTGLDHLKELGVTHVHLLPFYDFATLDESRPDSSQYNWGYEPLNYNAPEGSYATDAFNGATRITELKQLIKTFHENGLRVVMDVTYNHTSHDERMPLHQLVPGYYYRHDEEGHLSNATGCGNETASEQAMMRKLMLESVLYWTKEYHIDGFRFDLMGVHDISTMNLISNELHKLRPDILLYGEGWTAWPSPLAGSMRALKANVSHLDRIAVFNDDCRDAIKGHVFHFSEKGFVSGAPGMEESIKFGVTAACPHPQVQYNRVNYSRTPWASQPWQTVNYADCHDNHTLWDKLKLAATGVTDDERIEMQKLALSIVLTCQGIPFLHAGSEFLRSKKGVENSYSAPDSINGIDWGLKATHKDVFAYVKALIAMRKQHPAFRMRTAEQVQQYIRFEENMPANIVAYTIDGAALKDSWRKIRIYYNGSGTEQTVTLDSKNWQAGILNNQAAAGENSMQTVTLKPYSCTVLYLQIPGK